jgi:hypothetical protein
VAAASDEKEAACFYAKLVSVSHAVAVLKTRIGTVIRTEIR